MPYSGNHPLVITSIVAFLLLIEGRLKEHMTSHDICDSQYTPFSFSTLLQISLKRSWLSVLASSTKNASSRRSVTFLGSENDLHITKVTTIKVITSLLTVL